MNKLKSIYRFFSNKYQTVFLDYPVDPVPRYGHGRPPHPGLYDIVNANRQEYRFVIETALELKERFFEIRDVQDETNPALPVWNNGFLPGLDIIMIYTMLYLYKPGRYIEVGSGNSTKVAFKAIRDHTLDTEIISIDPQPRAEIDKLADSVIRAPFETAGIDLADMLEEGDILFIDNSHRILPNSDSMVFFMEVLPRLRKGVIVHIHDIYIPYDYPQFMCDRYYSEQYGLAINLLANPGRYNTLMPNYYVSEDPELSKLLEPVWDQPVLRTVEKHGGSYWLEIR